MTIPSALTVDGFNSLPADEAHRILLGCCASPAWARSLTEGRPYRSVDEILAAADNALDKIDDGDLDAALAGHPRIGERPAGDAGGFSGREQAGVATASAETRAALAEGNRAYEARFGWVYLVCATGRSGDELLAMLRERLANDPATERRVVRGELRKINRLRLEALVRP